MTRPVPETIPDLQDPYRLPEILQGKGLLSDPTEFPPLHRLGFCRPSENPVGPNSRRILTTFPSAKGGTGVAILCASPYNSHFLVSSSDPAKDEDYVAEFKDQAPVGDQPSPEILQAVQALEDTRPLDLPDEEPKFRPAPEFERLTSCNAFKAYCAYLLMRARELLPFLREEWADDKYSHVNQKRDVRIPVTFDGVNYVVRLILDEELYSGKCANTSLSIEVDSPEVKRDCAVQIGINDYHLAHLDWERECVPNPTKLSPREYVEASYENPAYTQYLGEKAVNRRFGHFKFNVDQSIPQFSNVEATRMVGSLRVNALNGNPIDPRRQNTELFSQGFSLSRGSEDQAVRTLELADRVLWRLHAVRNGEPIFG